ncbi:hypothetical protein N836_05655 [Leptolyngbya sp. Heron Island J]|nr:hypothetical protein N836_05655 [Leptolyngbya sp. Heron Island J]
MSVMVMYAASKYLTFYLKIKSNKRKLNSKKKHVSFLIEEKL